MNKFTKLLFIGVIILFTITACDNNPAENENDDPIPPEMSQSIDIEFTFPDSAEIVNFTSEQVDYNGLIVTGYSLDQFIDMDSVNLYIDEDQFDGRKLFAIEIVSSDDDNNWSPRQNDYYDLSWSDFISGYLLPSEKGRTYFPDGNIESGYNVKWAHYLRLYRKIDVVLTGNITTFETGALITEEITYTKDGESFTVDATNLKDFVSDYVTADPDDYLYLFTAADGWVNSDTGNMFSWAAMLNSYWLPELNKAIFLNVSFDTIYKSVKVVEKIELIEVQK